jgi:hypothetical protein
MGSVISAKRRLTTFQISQVQEVAQIENKVRTDGRYEQQYDRDFCGFKLHDDWRSSGEGATTTAALTGGATVAVVSNRDWKSVDAVHQEIPYVGPTATT